jgi:hypothetical protein
LPQLSTRGRGSPARVLSLSLSYAHLGAFESALSIALARSTALPTSMGVVVARKRMPSRVALSSIHLLTLEAFPAATSPSF